MPWTSEILLIFFKERRKKGEKMFSTEGAVDFSRAEADRHADRELLEGGRLGRVKTLVDEARLGFALFRVDPQLRRARVQDDLRGVRADRSDGSKQFD